MKKIFSLAVAFCVAATISAIAYAEVSTADSSAFVEGPVGADKENQSDVVPAVDESRPEEKSDGIDGEQKAPNTGVESTAVLVGVTAIASGVMILSRKYK